MGDQREPGPVDGGRRSTRAEAAAPLPVQVASGSTSASGGRRTIQAKLRVGAADDRFEREADRVAEVAVRHLRTRPDPQPSGPPQDGTTGGGHRTGDRIRRMTGERLPAAGTAPDHPGVGRISAITARAPGPGEATGRPPATRVQRSAAPIGMEGGALDTATEHEISAARSRGTPLGTELRRSMEQAIGADFSAVRVHVGPQSDALNDRIRARAFTTGADVFVRRSDYAPATTAGQRLIAHELAHTVQQGASPRRAARDERAGVDARAGAALVPGSDRSALERSETVRHDGGVTVRRFQGAIGTIARPTSHVIQRHAAYEHYLLGQLQPREIAAIPTVRKVEKNSGQKARIKKDASLGGGLEDSVDDDATRDEVRHLITQEMTRLLAFRKDSEALESQRDQMGQVGREAPDPHAPAPMVHGAQATHPKWKVPIVVLPCRDGSIVVSYSEVNTLPDLFGNPEAIAQTPKSKVLSLLQGVRQQLYIELDNLQKEIFGVSSSKLAHWWRMDEDFTGAAGPRAQAVNEGLYEKRTESQVNAATTRPGEEDEQYFAALERNACHFAPESWTQWRGYHERALAAATRAATLRTAGDEVNADLAANEALLLNGFGEHYLQDSFASGHLIDKTKIMRWFTIWIDEHGGHGSTEQGKGEWAMKAYAAKQTLQSNPQRLHDKAKRGEITTAQQGAAEIGMGNDPATALLVRWRAAAAATPALKHLTPAKAAEQFGLGVGAATGQLDRLVALKFAKRIGKRARPEYSLHQTNVKAAQDEQTGAYDATLALDPAGAHTVAAQAAEFDLEAYNLLMSDAHIQASTKYFHDTFCQQGLEVVTGGGDQIGRIYGDANMMNAGGQTGLEYAAETSRRSRSAVFHAIKGWRVPYSTDEIQQRFPTAVIVAGAPVALTTWNDGLRQQGEQGLFKKASSFGARIVEKTGVLGAKGGISATGALNLAAIQEIGVAKARLDQQRLERLLAELGIDHDAVF